MRAVKVIGVTIEGPPPAGRIHLRFDEGVSVFYGVNGAGKTTVLRAVSDALNGMSRRGVAAVHVRASEVGPLDWENLDWDPFLEELALALNRALADRVHDEYLDDVGNPNHEAGLKKLVHTLTSALGPELVAPWDGLVDEIASSGCFRLVPSRHEAGWTVYCAAPADGPITSEILRNRRWIVETGKAVKAGTHDADEFFAEVMAKDMCPMAPETKQSGWADTDPDWLPVPYLECGWLSTNGYYTSSTLELSLRPAGDLDALVARTVSLIEQFDHVLDMVGAEVIVDDRLSEQLDVVASRATETLATLLLDAPVLTCTLQHPKSWLRGRIIEWGATDRATTSTVLVGALSSAQHRWAVLAIDDALNVALSQHYDLARPVLVLDEPELGLHPQAQRHLASGLERMARRAGLTILAATHSPTLLTQPGVHLHHVARDAESGLSQVMSFTTPLRAALNDERWGIAPSDLLQFVRVFLVVEGEHDLAVIGGFIGPELEAHRTHVIAMRGAQRLNAVLDAQLIFDYTTAAVVVVLDRVRADPLRRAWEEARDATDPAQVRLATRRLEDFPTASKEEDLLVEFCRRAIGRRQSRRVHIHGLERPDIIEYLPASEIVPGATSWDNVKAGWDRTIDFKSYLRSLGGRPSVQQLRRVVADADEIPHEIAALVSVCETAGR